MSRERPYRIDTPSVPEKDAPPGYKLRFDRWSRQWTWRAPGSSIEHKAGTRPQAVAEAYDDLRATRADRSGSATMMAATPAPADGAPPDAAQSCDASVVRADRSE